MGQTVSIANTKNDFELVIRATKELEWLLETHFGAPSGKNVGLHDKISAARDPRTHQPLPDNVIRKMRVRTIVGARACRSRLIDCATACCAIALQKLVTIRNALVHDRDVNAIDDRAGFVKGWKEVEAALHHALPSTGSSCIVC